MTSPDQQRHNDLEKHPAGGDIVRLGWGLYQQVAAVLAAFGLAALFGHFLDIGWRGFLETLVGYWSDYVRPVMQFALHTLVSAPLRWAFGWHVELPLLFRDYLTVGIIVLASAGRTDKDYLPRLRRTWRRRDLGWPLSLLLACAILVIAFPLILVAWPAYTIAVATTFSPLTKMSEWSRLLQFLAPLLYLGLLLVVNYLVLR